MSMAQQQQLHELPQQGGLLKDEKKTEISKVLKARVAMLEAKTDKSSNESLSAEKSKAEKLSIEKAIGNAKLNPFTFVAS